MEDKKKALIAQIETFLKEHGEEWNEDGRFIMLPKDEKIHIVQQYLDGYIQEIELMYDDEGVGIPELYFYGKCADSSMFTIDDEHLTVENIEVIAKALHSLHCL